MVGAGTAAAAKVRLMTALAPVSQDAKFDRDRVGQVTGHKTRAVFDRYHIVSPADLQEVARRLAGSVTGTLQGTPTPEA